MKSNKKFRKDDLSPESNTKKIYKMYKRKKQWVVAPVVFGLLLNALSPVAALAVTDTEQANVETTELRAATPKLQALIEQAVTNINALKSLLPEEKAKYVEAIEKAETEEVVEAKLLAAYKDDVLQETKNIEASYDAEIDALTSLTDKEASEKEIKAALDLANLVAKFNEITKTTDYSVYKGAFDASLAKNVVAANEKLEDAKALNAALADLPKYKTDQKAVVDGLSQLQEIEKEGYYTVIDEAADKAAVDGIVEGAKNVNQLRLEDAIKDKVAELKAETEKLATVNSSKQVELDSKIDEAAISKDDAALAKLVGLTAEVNKAVEDALANDTEAKLNTEKSKLKTDITNEKKTNKLITDADVKTFTAKADKATTIGEVNAVRAEWNSFVAATNIKDIEKLEDAKKEGIKLLIPLKIDPVLNANYQREVQLAQTSAEVSAIVARAQADERKALEQKAAELAAAKTQAIKDINALTNLTKAEKKAKTDEVNEATDVATINALVKEAKDADEASALNKEKTAAKAKVDGLEYLSDLEKTEVKKYIDDATDSVGITKELNDAIYANYEAGVASADIELADAKAIAKEAVNQLENLTAGQRASALTDIAEAKDKPKLNDALTAAKKLDQLNASANAAAAELAKAKEVATAEIDELKYLSKEMKAGYKAEIANAKDTTAIDTVLYKAKKQDDKLSSEQAEFEDAKKALVEKINSSNELTATDKKELIAQAIDCKTKDEVETLEVKVDQLILDRKVEAAEEANAKSEINEAIGKLGSLSPEQIKAYQDKVDALDKKADMVKVYEEAKAQSNKVHDKGIVNLIDQYIASGSYVEAQKAINTLLTDSTREECQAKLDASIALAEAKAAANKQIDALENLSAKEKAAAKEKVATLTSKADVDDYVAELVKADNLAHDKDLIELAEAQIKAKDFDKAAKTIERIRDADTKAKLQKLLEDAQKVAPAVQGTAHVSKQGWLGTVGTNEVIGTTGKALALEAVKLELADVEMPEAARNVEGGIEYRAHVRKIGWQDSKANGDLAGTTGKALQMEAIQIKLTGELAKKYDVQYRAHSQSVGWGSYVSNGATAGTTGKKLRMEAIQVRLVEK